MSKIFPHKTIVDFLENPAKKFSTKIALVFEGKKYTYGQLNDASTMVAAKLSNVCPKKSTVALMASNGEEFIVAYFGILKAGFSVLLLNPNMSDSNFRYQVETISPRLIVTQAKFFEKLARTGFSHNLKFMDIAKDFRKSVEFKNPVTGENDISTIIFTSGTSSLPKAAVLRHYNVTATTSNIVNYLDFNANDIDVNISGLSHSFGLGHIHSVFSVGGTVILHRDAINLKGILQSIIENGATTFAAVPAILQLLIENYSRDLKTCGKYLRMIQTNTSPLEKDLILKLLSLTPKTQFAYYYGLSEASRATFITFGKNRAKIKSVGKSMPGVYIKIVDGNNKKLPAGILGEICIRGKIVIRNYFRDPMASARIKKGWLFTGDLGYLDDDGYLYFKGRKDDIVNVSGEKVFPEEVEEKIKNIAGVVDAGVIGVSDRFLGQAIKAFIVTNDDNFDKNLVISECGRVLESYKVPRYVDIVSKIPRTENGKLQRNLLKKR